MDRLGTSFARRQNSLISTRSDAMYYGLAQAFCSAFRFSEYRIGNRLFRGAANPLILHRNLFGSQFSIEVSRSPYHQVLFLTGERAIPERHFFRRLLRPGMHFVDVGANIGYYLAMFEQLLEHRDAPPALNRRQRISRNCTQTSVKMAGRMSQFTKSPSVIARRQSVCVKESTAA